MKGEIRARPGMRCKRWRIVGMLFEGCCSRSGQPRAAWISRVKERYELGSKIKKSKIKSRKEESQQQVHDWCSSGVCGRGREPALVVVL